MVIGWAAWANTASEKAARKVLERIQRKLGYDVMNPSVKLYQKTPAMWAIRFQIRLVSETWNDRVVEVIALGQRVARTWILTGNVHDDLSGWSNEPVISGVRSFQWELMAHPVTFLAHPDDTCEHGLQADADRARNLHLLFDVRQKAGPHASWEIVTTGLADLEAAIAFAKTLQVYESGVFTNDPDVGGYVYWTSSGPDAFNHSVIGMKVICVEETETGQ